MYDPAGNLLLGGRRPAQNSYDALHRLITSIAGTDTAVFHYDAGGQVRAANNSSARISRRYNANGTLSTDTLRIKNVNYQLFADHVYGLRFGYDLNARRAWMKHPSQLTPVVGGVRQDSVAYTYDPVTGAIASIRDGFGHRYASSYDNANRVSALMRRLATGDTTVETRRYDAESRLVRRIQEVPAALLIHSDSLRYDARGKVRKHVLTGDTVEYSPLGHVTLASFNGATESFTVDALGNRTSGIQAADAAIPSTYKYQAGSGRQLDIVHDAPGPMDDTTFQSNATGDLTLQAKKHYWTVDCGPGCKDTLREERRTRHEYNARGQLVQTVYNFDSIPAPRYLYQPYRSEESFRYDALGRRVWRRIIRGSNCQAQDPSSGCQSAVDRFVWDGNEILHEIRAAGDSAATDAAMESDANSVGYVHGTAIDEPLMIFKGTTVVLPYTNWRGLFARATCPVLQCPLDNPEFPAANAGTFGSGSYDSDGPSSWWGSLIEHGQDAHGFQYRRNRYYDPKTGRFTQEDPTGLAGGLNLYGFANGDPVNFYDPFGLDAIYIHYNGYMVNTGMGFKLPLGHAAVIAVDKNGYTRYYEYGRYDKAGFGVVRRREVPNLVMGKDGKPTEASLKRLYDFVSKNYGQGRPVSADYDAEADFQKVVDFAEERMNDPNRDEYNLFTNNCKTFARDACEAGKKQDEEDKKKRQQ